MFDGFLVMMGFQAVSGILRLMKDRENNGII